MAITTVTVGDISDAWAVGVLDDDGVAMDLTDFTCSIVVIKKADNSTVLSKNVTQKDANGKFLVFFDESETALFSAGTLYRLAIEVENQLLTKPIKKEATRDFQAVAGWVP